MGQSDMTDKRGIFQGVCLTQQNAALSVANQEAASVKDFTARQICRKWRNCAVFWVGFNRTLDSIQLPTKKSEAFARELT